MTFEYWTFGNAGAMVQLLNAIAAIMSPNSDYVGLIRLAGLFGFLAIVFTGLFKNDPFPVMQWLIGIVFIWYALFIPRVTLVVTDQNPNVSASSVAIGNVPLGLGLVATVGSKMSYYLTKTAELAFSLPDSMKFSKAGLMQPQRILMQASAYNMPDATLDADWQTFFHECTYYDINVYSKRLRLPGFVNRGDITAPDLDIDKSADPLATLGHTNKKLFLTIYTGGQAVRTCDEAYAILNFASNSLAANPSIQVQYARMAFPNLPASEALTAWNQAVSDANNVLLRAPRAGAETLINMWTVNLLKMSDTRSAISSGNTALAMVEFGAIQAQQQRLSAYAQSARAGQETMPIVRNVAEAVLIGLFPVVLVFMIAGGANGLRTFFEWALIFISLQLWGFLFALFNMIMVSKSSGNIYALAANASSPGVSVGNSFGVAESLTGDMAIVGIMLWVIPVLAYGLMKGLGQAGLSMMKSGAGTAQSTAEKVGSDQGAGNFSVGSGQFNTTKANTTDVGNSQSIGDGRGQTNVYGQGGNLFQNTGAASSISGMKMTRGDMTSLTASKAADVAETNSKNQSTTADYVKSAAVGEAISSAIQSGSSTSLEKGWQQAGQSDYSGGLSATAGLVDKVSQSTGADQKTAASIVASAGVSGGWGLPGAVTALTGAVGKAQLSSAVKKELGANAQAKFDSAQGSDNSSQYKQAAQFTNSLSSSSAARSVATGGTQNSRSVEGKIQQADSLRQQSQASSAAAQSLRETATAAKSDTRAFSMDMAANKPEFAQAMNTLAKSPGFANASADQQMQMARDAIGAMSISAMPELPANLPSGKATPTSQSMGSDFAASSAAVQAQGEAGIAKQKAAAPRVSVGGPNISGVVNAVEGGQTKINSAVTSGGGSIGGQQNKLNNQVQPNLPKVDSDGVLSVPQGQVGQAVRQAGNELGNTVKPLANALDNQEEKLQKTYKKRP